MVQSLFHPVGVGGGGGGSPVKRGGKYLLQIVIHVTARPTQGGSKRRRFDS